MQQMKTVKDIPQRQYSAEFQIYDDRIVQAVLRQWTCGVEEVKKEMR